MDAVGGTLAGPDWRVAFRGKWGPLEKPLERWAALPLPLGWRRGNNVSSGVTSSSSSSRQG